MLNFVKRLGFGGREGAVQPVDRTEPNKINEVLDVCQRVSKGDFEARILNIPEDDSTERALCLTINELIDRTDAYVRESTACLGYMEQNQYFRRINETGMLGSFLVAARAINKAADGIEGKMNFFGDLVKSLSGASDALQNNTNEMKQATEATGEQSTNVAAGAEEALTNVQTVASTAEELNAAISEINRQVTQSTQMASDAEVESRKTSEAIGELSETSEQIGEIVGIIADIAAQTNLLALNATIEAARAGESGKGFAVVASEVKALASQTSKATDQISAQINAVQDVTEKAVKSNVVITEMVAKLNEVSGAIAAAVEQQGAATTEIARSMEEAAKGVEDITKGIGVVSQNVQEVNAASGEVFSISTDLASSAASLQETLAKKSA